MTLYDEGSAFLDLEKGDFSLLQKGENLFKAKFEGKDWAVIYGIRMRRP